ncbi:protein FAM24A [Rattus rattus]|uniref:protein FAM24A n=1 Tax=Rattus rattus TaxID=10117 RepID=UPI0013F37B0B|nr:protein FAM24A [Rattus rattus]
MFDLRTKVMIGIASTLLIAAIVLITVVFCLYLKISKALKCAREIESCMDPTKAASEKMIRGKPIIADPCRPLQCCDNCSLFKDVGAMPPCFCGTNEGL